MTPRGARGAGAPPGLTRRAMGGMVWTFSGTGVQVVVQLRLDRIRVRIAGEEVAALAGTTWLVALAARARI